MSDVPLVQSLLRAVRRPEALPHASAAEVEWALATGLGPWLYHQLGRCPSAVDPDAAARCLSSDLTARILYGERQRLIGDFLAACRAQAIEVVLLKGISIAGEFYPEPHWRTMGDVDLLVAPEDLAAAEALLRERGYRQESEQSADFYRTHHHSMPFHLPEAGLWIELHTGLFPPDEPEGRLSLFTPAAWRSELRESRFAGQPAWRFSPEFQLLYLACHWNGRLKPVGGVFGLFDALWLLSGAPQLDWQQVRVWLKEPLLAHHFGLLAVCLERFGCLDAPLLSGLPRPLSHKPAAVLVQRYLLEGRPPGRWLTQRNRKIVWHCLTGPGPESMRWLRLPWRLLFPPQEQGRYRLAPQLRRLQGMFRAR